MCAIVNRGRAAADTPTTQQRFHVTISARWVGSRGNVLSRRVKCNRCLIPVSGYYEWQDTPSGEQPWYFSARDGAPALTIAGLWDEW
jgi:putative SOS response-associated peptidase YedK